MPGTFIISFDCEGKWGMADRITAHHDRVITREALIAAYGKILALLTAREIPASFAFVMAFVLTDDERRDFGPELSDITVNGDNWLRHYRAAELRGNLDGWFCPEALELVRRSAQHEVACHGFRHVPLSEPGVSRTDAEAEISSAAKVAQLKGINLATFVFPRNQVRHVEVLRAYGYCGYRTAPPTRRGRLSAMLREFHLRQKAQDRLAITDELVAIPAGYFLNWRSGPRRLIPKWVTAARWRAIINDAVNNDRVAHVWLHPHNIIDGPETFDVLDRLLMEVVSARRRSGMQTITQATYCQQALCNPPQC